ncbi:hypothetical protein PUW24_26495 (plasmid) [Paenibacillus urinalis]|uniref:KfrA N-terminal DNA-binding domain-containing protein n=1 Tax=Paenibacillus urinalis TaxID=521520 RepID=A0ABY7XP98_9BACL|nr:hypothetical protein [Paenibacillus urinalis]WDI00119.1 hypothetical protein PUW24_26545 [Paenibacillus urinalis]WDI00132.1 hypothetical protein PUW24_26495 [Paenibacillus urinalis]WDI05430.1 hypothetical protein PUW25_27415 [Paenibacillus urinalis]
MPYISSKPDILPGHIAMEDAIERLQGAGLMEKDAKYPAQIVRRLISAGEIEGTMPGSKYHGYQVVEESLLKYIAEQSMSRQELLERSKRLESAEMERDEAWKSLKELKKENAKLKRQLAKLDPTSIKAENETKNEERDAE